MGSSATIDSAAATDRLLTTLGEQLSLAEYAYDLIVIGGALVSKAVARPAVAPRGAVRSGR
jgi:hypothetical protein